MNSTARLLGLGSLCSDGNASIGLAEQKLPAEGDVSSVEMRSPLMLILIPAADWINEPSLRTFNLRCKRDSEKISLTHGI